MVAYLLSIFDELGKVGCIELWARHKIIIRLSFYNCTCPHFHPSYLRDSFFENLFCLLFGVSRVIRYQIDIPIKIVILSVGTWFCLYGYPLACFGRSEGIHDVRNHILVSGCIVELHILGKWYVFDTYFWFEWIVFIFDLWQCTIKWIAIEDQLIEPYLFCFL